MDNESFVAMIKDPQAKRVIYELLKRVEVLEQNNQPINPIGFHMKGGEHTLETAFISKQNNVQDSL